MAERVLARDLKQHEGQRIVAQGWVHNVRALGEVNFLIVRDRSGLMQAVASKEALQPLEGWQLETVVEVEGTVTAAR